MRGDGHPELFAAGDAVFTHGGDEKAVKIEDDEAPNDRKGNRPERFVKDAIDGIAGGKRGQHKGGQQDAAEPGIFRLFGGAFL